MSVDRTRYYSASRDRALAPAKRPEPQLDGFDQGGPSCVCDTPLVSRGSDACGRCRRTIP